MSNSSTRSPRVGPGQAIYQWVTAAWRRKALRLLALQNDTSMGHELEQAIDARLAEHGIPLGDGQ